MDSALRRPGVKRRRRALTAAQRRLLRNAGWALLAVLAVLPLLWVLFFAPTTGKFATSFDTDPPAVWTSIGTEIAYLLSSMRNSTGSLRLLALFSASHHSPSLVVPSPAEQ